MDARNVPGEAFIMPSPGERGAFACTRCGGTDLELVPSPSGEAIVRLMCSRCFNYLDFAVVKEEEACAST